MKRAVVLTGEDVRFIIAMMERGAYGEEEASLCAAIEAKLAPKAAADTLLQAAVLKNKAALDRLSG